LKRIFEGRLSPQISSKSLCPQRDGAPKKGEKVLKKERKRKKKAPRVSSNKKGKSIFWEKKNIATSKSFLYEYIFFCSIIPF
jgi:hypothetical protein